MNTQDANRPGVRGLIPSDAERVKLAAYLEGQRVMRDRIANDLTFVAEQLPTRGATDVLWRYIMRLKSETIT